MSITSSGNFRRQVVATVCTVYFVSIGRFLKFNVSIDSLDVIMRFYLIGSGHDVIDEISDNIGNSNLSRLSPDENEKDEPSNLVSSLGADSPTVTSDIVVTNSNTSNTSKYYYLDHSFFTL